MKAVHQIITTTTTTTAAAAAAAAAATTTTINGDNNCNNKRIQRRNSRLFTISLLLREPSPTRTLKWPGRNCVQITCNTSSAFHVQHVVCHGV